MPISQQIAAGDLSLFAHVGSQTSDADRRSLLAVHHAVAERTGSFSYLEIGSHLGGTLQAFMVDPRCRRVVSIDPRPPAQPDDRGEVFVYAGNSTARMLSLLAGVPGAALEKLETIELGTEDIAPGSLPRPDLCLVDGEHTYAAALRDGRFCRAVMQGAGTILFHDREIVEPAILDFLREVSGPVAAYPLRGSLFAVELGATAPLTADPAVAAQLGPPAPVLWRAAARLGLSARLTRAAGYRPRRRKPVPGDTAP
ncbi:MAG: class I SAM-dependent methyltransferase [Solirubrobacteraceae bacterium]